MVMRSYTRRNRVRRVEEVEGLRAVRLEGAVEQGIGDSPPLPPERIRPFERAGWRFVGRDAALGMHPQPSQSARVLIGSDGRVLLSPNRLTVKFRPTLSQEDVQRLVSEAGCRIATKLPLADNTFVLEPREAEALDAFSVAEKLSARDETEFAEPELIEQLGER
jgi:hypothetical protein